jgi:hypothetical protein
MKSFFTTSILATLVFINFSQAQVNQGWIAYFNPPGSMCDYGYAIAVDIQGNIFVTGTGDGFGGNSMKTVKYSSSGVQLWFATYDTTEGICNTVDKEGNVYAGGYGMHEGGVNSDYVIIKYAPNGADKWHARYNGPGNSYDYIHSIVVDNSCNVYVTGESYGGSNTSFDIATVKYDSSGVQQWAMRYNGSGNGIDCGNCVAVSNIGNVYVTGYMATTGGYHNTITIKYNSAGVQQWADIFSDPIDSMSSGTSIAVDNSNNAYVTIRALSRNQGYDYVTIKYDTFGKRLWVDRYNDSLNNDDKVYDLKLDQISNVYVTGSSRDPGTGMGYKTIKYNSSGVQQWVVGYPGTNIFSDYRAYALALDTYKNVYVTGYTIDQSGIYNYTTIKYNTNGVQQWLMNYGVAGSANIAYAIAVDTACNVFVTGYGMGKNNHFAFITIKYSQELVKVGSAGNEIPYVFQLAQNYPNPFNPTTTLEIKIPKTAQIKLIIYDILGREVMTVLNEKLSPGTYKYEWDGSSFPSGVYFYKLTTIDYTMSRKMILLK